MVYGFGNQWESEFEQCTLYSGIERYVLDRSSGNRVATVVFLDAGEYVINNSVYVYCGVEKYRFFFEDALIAEIVRTKDESVWKPQNGMYNYETYFKVLLTQGITPEWKMLIMAFPLLRHAF
jgi:hypothetical protein